MELGHLVGTQMKLTIFNLQLALGLSYQWRKLAIQCLGD